MTNAEKFSSRVVLVDVTCRNYLTGIERRRSNFGISSTHWLFRFPLAFPPPLLSVCVLSKRFYFLYSPISSCSNPSISVSFSFFTSNTRIDSISYLLSPISIHFSHFIYPYIHTPPFLILPANSGFSFPIIISSNFTSFLSLFPLFFHLFCFLFLTIVLISFNGYSCWVFHFFFHFSFPFLLFISPFIICKTFFGSFFLFVFRNINVIDWTTLVSHILLIYLD